jgi:hypothetical protein
MKQIHKKLKTGGSYCVAGLSVLNGPDAAGEGRRLK